jgi:hypothetical protein
MAALIICVLAADHSKASGVRRATAEPAAARQGAHARHHHGSAFNINSVAKLPHPYPIRLYRHHFLVANGSDRSEESSSRTARTGRRPDAELVASVLRRKKVGKRSSLNRASSRSTGGARPASLYSSCSFSTKTISYVVLYLFFLLFILSDISGTKSIFRGSCVKASSSCICLRVGHIVAFPLFLSKNFLAS